ncbi:unnamed protein product [Heterobilharzia americana]|nr:unnamed protein product [Heterobilharzia americana]
MVPTMVVAQNGVSDSGVDENEDHNEITDKKKVRTSNKNDSSDLVVGILQNQCKDHISDENSSKNEIKEMNDEGKHLSSFLTDDQNDSEEKILDELFNRKQLLLRRLSEEIHKYEQLCWDEMAITRIVPDQSSLPSKHLNVRCNSETRNPLITTPQRTLDPNNSLGNSTNRSRGIAARLKFRNSRRSKSAHERIPESPHRSLLQRNKVEISPTRNSLTDNLLDDNLESKKSWKWWRINKDSGLISNIRRRQSIGMIAEQYFRYFTNDKNGHSRAGSLPPTDSNACENETKKSIPTDIAKANDRKSFQLEQFLHFLNIQNQNGVQSDHLGTYPPPHHSYYYHQQQEQLKQVHRQPQVNEVSIQQPACILSPSFACPNQFQQVNCNHQRIRNFSGSQASQDKIPPHQMVNGFHKTLELKPIEHFGLTHQLQQQRPPSKFISYHFTPNTYEFSLNHYNQRSSVVNRRDKFKCNENRGTNFIDNFNRNPSQNPFQLEKLVKEDSVNTMNVKLQPSQSLTNNFSQWPCKDKHINHEPFLVYQLNQPRLRNIPQREIKGAKNSQPVSLSNQTNTALSGCRIVKNPSSGWEINLGCACSKPVSTNYPKPGNFGQCWRPIIEPKETLNQNQSLPLNNPQDIQYSQAIIGGYYAVEKKIPRRKCQYESTTQSRSRKNHSNNSSNHQREHSYCPNYRQ